MMTPEHECQPTIKPILPDSCPLLRDSNTPLPATTTLQQDLMHEGQRRINLIWERTQAIVALTVIISAMIDCVWGFIYTTLHPNIHMEIPNLLAVAFGTVVGFYFSRTNHSAVGGVSGKAIVTEYTGR